MTKNDTSPENLRKFLESDDPALVRMGLSMAKAVNSDDINVVLIALSDDNSTNRLTARKDIFERLDDYFPQILTCLKNRKKIIYESTIELLGQTKSVKALSPLLKLLTDPKKAKKNIAFNSIEILHKNIEFNEKESKLIANYIVNELEKSNWKTVFGHSVRKFETGILASESMLKDAKDPVYEYDEDEILEIRREWEEEKESSTLYQFIKNSYVEQAILTKIAKEVNARLPKYKWII